MISNPGRATKFNYLLRVIGKTVKLSRWTWSPVRLPSNVTLHNIFYDLDKTALTSPRRLIASNVTSHSVHLAWVMQTRFVSEYRVVILPRTSTVPVYNDTTGKYR